MRSERGYTLFEVLIVLAFIGVVSAIALPVFTSSNQMNTLWTNSERIGAVIRQTRLRAITQNTTYELRFNCPAAGQMRALVMTGDGAVDNAPGRCSDDAVGDGEIIDMPFGVAYDTGDATGVQVTGRGVFTAVGDAIPLTLSVTYGGNARYITLNLTGQLTFSETEPE